MEEERLAQGHRLDGVVKILASEQLHLGTERERAGAHDPEVASSHGDNLSSRMGKCG